MALSAQAWLDRLAKRIDAKRPRIDLLRSYLEGNPPLPENDETLREAYKRFQKKARTNFAELVVEAVAERMVVSGFRVGDAQDGGNQDDDDARRIWKANRLGVWSADVHRDMLALSTGYTCVQPVEGGGGVEITYERPEQVITDHDPARPDRVRAALKVYRDDVEGIDVAYVHVPGQVARFTRRSTVERDGVSQPILTVSGGWDVDSVEIRDTGLRTVPIVPFVNRSGLGEYETHLDLLDRINWVILQRLVITAMQAFRQRATKGSLPEVDEQGKPINYDVLFRPGPGALWQLPDGVDLWESQPTDLTPVLESVKADIRDLAAVTRTPVNMLMPEGANQTAEGASFAKEGLVFKSKDRINRAAVSWSETMRIALAIERGGEDRVPEVEVLFLPPERQSLAERFDALSKAGDDVPWRTKMEYILQFDGDMVDRMEAQRAQDMLLASTLATQNQPTAPAQPGQPGVTGRAATG